MRKILITGGTGFLGTNLYHFLRQTTPNSDVYIFSRRTGSNIKDSQQIAEAIKGKNLIIHTAAQTFTQAGLQGSRKIAAEFEATNYSGTLNVIAACRLHHVPLIHVSTGEIYGSNVHPSVPMTEDHPFNPQMGPYAVSKLEGDKAVQAAISDGLDARIIRPSGMFGLFQTQEKLFPKFINLISSGKPVTLHGDGQQVRDYSSVEDIAHAIWLLRKTPAGTIVNASNSRPYTLKQMTEIIIKSCRRHGLKGQIVHIADRPNQVQEFLISHAKLSRLTGWKPKKFLEQEIDRMVDFYLAKQLPTNKFFFLDEPKVDKPKSVASSNRVEYASAVYGEEEIKAVNEVLRSRWLAPATKTRKFETKVAKIFGKQHGLFVNSGSSAVFLSVRVFDFPSGKEIITPASTFATTVSAILQNNLEPVFVDSDLGTYNANIEEIEAAISKDTVAILVPHIIGNLNDMPKLSKIAKKHQLRLIEDSCDTIGAKINGQPAGSWSDTTATSFYFVHHITAAGGGGMVMFDRQEWHEKAFSFRDWGRAGTGYDESLKKRFSHKLNRVPYDAKFVSQNFGYNLKGVEVQGAFGLAQLKKLPRFNRIRSHNMKTLIKFFSDYEEFFILPKLLPNSQTYFLSFPLTIRPQSPFDRLTLVKFLEKYNIQTRPLFTGNILYHPAYKNMPHRVASSLKNADIIMSHAYVSPCHHALTNDQLDYLFNTYQKFFKLL